MNENSPHTHQQGTMAGARPSESETEVIDLRFLFKVIYRGKWWVVLLTLASLAYGLQNVRNFEPKFVVEMIIEPANEAMTVGGRKDVQNIARVIGISTGGRQGFSPIRRLELVLGSQALAHRLQDRYGLFMRIFKDSWDESSQSWIKPSSFRFETEQMVRRFLHLGNWLAPSIESLAQYLSGAIEIEALGETPVQRMRMEHHDGEFALFLLSTAFREADGLLRDQDKRLNERDKEYLRKRLETEVNLNSRNVLLTLLEKQEQTGMLLDRGHNYVARIIEPARILRTKTMPNITAKLIVPGLIGFFVAALGIALVALFRAE